MRKIVMILFTVSFMLALGACNSAKKCGCPTFKSQLEQNPVPSISCKNSIDRPVVLY
jgi:hypothetical protein